jgi:hypothetical protein
MRHYVNDEIRAAVRGHHDGRKVVQSLRRRALRIGDENLAATCLLQMIALARDELERVRLLRRYANETRSLLAVYFLSEVLVKQGRTAASKNCWRLVSWRNPAPSRPPEEEWFLAEVFGFKARGFSNREAPQ